jgi:hypothetical protein
MRKKGFTQVSSKPKKMLKNYIIHFFDCYFFQNNLISGFSSKIKKKIKNILSRKIEYIHIEYIHGKGRFRNKLILNLVFLFEKTLQKKNLWRTKISALFKN